MRLLLFQAIFLFTSALYAQNLDQEQTAILETINKAYANGLQNEGDSIAIDHGFHPDFYLLGRGTVKSLRKLSIHDWRARQIKNRADGKLPRPKDKLVSIDPIFIDITDQLAVAKIKYLEGGVLTYIDYISLYKYEGSWKIVSKVYQPIENP